VWGRGSIDDKGSLVTLMEAAEFLARQGRQPVRTIIFAFGHDEEIGGDNGAIAMAQALKARAVSLGAPPAMPSYCSSDWVLFKEAKAPVFIIDGAGIIRHSQVYAPGTIPESADLLGLYRDFFPRDSVAATRISFVALGAMPARLPEAAPRAIGHVVEVQLFR
jgi:hypothetical protein